MNALLMQEGMNHVLRKIFPQSVHLISPFDDIRNGCNDVFNVIICH